jgi:hypothetical protein
MIAQDPVYPLIPLKRRINNCNATLSSIAPRQKMRHRTRQAAHLARVTLSISILLFKKAAVSKQPAFAL